MQKRLSMMIVSTVAFMLAVAGMQYAQSYAMQINPIFFYITEVLMLISILGACEISAISAILVSVVSPLVMLLFGDTTIISAIVLAFANILVVLFMILFRSKKLIGLICGVAARFAVSYIGCIVILVPLLRDIRELGYGVIDKVNFMMLVTSVIGAAIYYCVGLISSKNKNETVD